MLYKFCNKLGCNKLIDVAESFCDAHKSEVGARYKEYDRNKRNKEAAKFYASDAWVRARKHILNYYNGLDIYEYYVNNRLCTADTVHHIIELREDWNKRLTLDNLVALSSANHNTIHNLYCRNKIEIQKLLREIQKKFAREFKT